MKTFNIFRCVVRKFCLTCTMTVKRFQKFTGGSWPAWFTSNNYSSHTFKSMSYFSCSFESSKSLAIFFTTVSFLPQAIKTLKTRRVKDLSLITYLFLFLGSLSWFLYGNYLNDIPLMATNSMTTVLTGLILFLIVKEKRSTI